MFFDEADIKQLGVRNSAHRAHIVSSLVALRDKHQRGGELFDFIYIYRGVIELIMSERV